MRKKLLTFFIFLSIPLQQGDAGSWPKGDGKISLYHYHTKELMEAEFRKKGEIQNRAFEKIQKIFRSRLDAKEHPIDIKLIDLLDHIQDHFEADTIELISGYRSPTLNANLRRKGYEVAEESQHMEGKAADIHIDEVTEEGLAEYVRSLHVGGVGYYPKSDFVHVDVVEPRYWELPDTPTRPFIAMRRGEVWQIYTDKSIYLPDEQIELIITNQSRKEQMFDSCPDLELYRRGKWNFFEKIDCAKKEILVGGKATFHWNPKKTEPYGKYRITLPSPKDFPHLQIRSNEFYRKRF